MTKKLPPKKAETMLSARVDPDFHHAVRRYALEKRSSVRNVVIRALQEYMKRHP